MSGGNSQPNEGSEVARCDYPVCASMYHWGARGWCNLIACPRRPARQPIVEPRRVTDSHDNDPRGRSWYFPERHSEDPA